MIKRRYIHEVWRYRIEERHQGGTVKDIYHLEEKICVIKYKKAFTQWVIKHYTELPTFPVAFRLIDVPNQTLYAVDIWIFKKSKWRPIYFPIENYVFYGEPIGLIYEEPNSATNSEKNNDVEF